MSRFQNISIIIATLFFGACQQADNNQRKVNSITENTSQALNFDVPYEKFTLDNGLTVILHEDHSDPIVALATIVHVGSSREKPGRTGFAHFFEHMAFNNSENVPMGANRKMIPELGGTRNGGTWSDGTRYYEVVPKDAFEKLMWIDSDRFGYMINTVAQGTLEREKQVVKNEKRQRVDNRAYGHTGHVIRKALYPKNHPYNWTVIGDLEDLQNATLSDVREFYEEFYIPANATLVIAGDIDVAQTKLSVQKWFGEIKAAPALKDLEPMPVVLKQSINLYHLDNFAKLPELTLTFATVEQYHKDSYALSALGYVLSQGKQSPLFTTVVADQKLAPSVNAYQDSSELTGTFSIKVRANAGVDLDDVYASIEHALQKFEENGLRKNDLIKIKAFQETNFYQGISSVLGKAFQLGIYSEFAGDPDFIKQDIANILAVSEQDVVRVYNKYIKGQKSIITSFVPKDALDLTVKGSVLAHVVEEQITQGKEQQFEEDANPKFVKTPSQHDRREPPLSELPQRESPEIWHHQLSNGMGIIGIEWHELPLINFTVSIKSGQMLDSQDKQGTAYLLAALMNEGTATKTPAELEDALGLLGSSVYVSASKTEITVSASTLKRNYQETMEIVTDLLLNPRFDGKDFTRLKNKRLTGIQASLANPNAVANTVMMKKLYGDEHVLGQISGGNKATVQNIELNDVIEFYNNKLSIENATFQIVGDYDNATVIQSIAQINKQWQTNKSVQFPEMPAIQWVDSPQVYFVDFPEAKQSVLYIGKPTVNTSDKDFNRVNIVNNRLGRGSSARLTQILRIQKGYTYGAYSRVVASQFDGTFIAATQVRSNVTLESLNIIKDQLQNYHTTFSAEELAVTKNLIIKGNSRQFETMGQLMGIIRSINQYGYADDYQQINQQELEKLSLPQAHQIIQTHLNEQQMIYVIVGDADSQLDRIRELGYGEPIVLDRQGNEIGSP